MFLKISEHFRNSKYTNEHLNGNNRTYQKFILLTYRRTGANYLLDLLRSHPDIVAFATMFEYGKLVYVYPGYPSLHCKKTLKYRDKYPFEFLKKRVFRNYSHNIKAVGFKMVYETRHPEVLEYIKNKMDIKVIHLQRKNLLRVYLSDTIASTTNTWHILSKEHEQFVKDIGAESRVRIIEKNDLPVSADDFKIALKYKDCLKEFIKISNYTKKFKNYFKPEQVLNIYYEDLLVNFNEEIRKVQDFLGVEYRVLTSRFIKINRKKLSDTISNYTELKEKFAGSKWEVFFEN